MYLDTKGLVALWREALLAKHVLEGRTKGYRHHPQLRRFKTVRDPVSCVNTYLLAVYEEAVKRGYNFDRSKIDSAIYPEKLTVTKGQIDFEGTHLLNKLKIRDKDRYKKLLRIEFCQTHPLFRIIDGGVEDWEVTK